MFKRIPLKVRELLSHEDGQAAAEYAMVIVFLVVGLGVSLGALGVSIGDFLNQVAATLDAVVP
jgi:Flp pilus assembly pilin Flp